MFITRKILKCCKKKRSLLILISNFRYSILIDEAIEVVLKKRNEQPLGSLTSQDLFYVKTTKIHELFKVLAGISDETVIREQSTSRISQILLDISVIILVGFENSQ